MGNFKYPINQNGTATIKTAGKYCDRDIDVTVNVTGGSGGDTEAAYQQGFTDGKKEGFSEGKQQGIAEGAVNEDWLISGVGNMDEYVNDRVTEVRQYGFNQAPGPKIVRFPNVGTVNTYAFSNNKVVEEAYFPNASRVLTYVFQGASALKTVDMGEAESIGYRAFYNASSVSTIVLRKTGSITTLSSTGVFDGSPLANGGAGGTVYVPDTLKATYEQAANWSALNCTFVPLEGSEYQ